MRTVLLGIGGTGSKIVNNVVVELKEHDIPVGTPEVVCAVLDTNDNDRKKLEQTEVGTPIIATSKEQKITEYVKMYASHGVKEWLPLSSTLMEHNMKNGASQFRIKSRLAFYDTMNTASMIKELEDQLDKVFTQRMGEEVRVMVVSSISGGTGSGMFIQLGLWLRKFFDDKGCAASIRGMFLLPDVFIGTLKDMADDNFEKGKNYANAYAAIRELNAITKIRTKGLVPAHPIKLDGLFDSERDCNCGTPVYDYAFFIDKESSAGEPITDIDEYNRIAAKLVYAQLYNPMKDNMYSEEDNLYDKFRTAKDPVYATCGVSVAEYPIKDILEYCELTALNDSLSSSWLKIDDEIQKLKDSEERNRIKGARATKVIDNRTEFINIFDERLKRTEEQSGSERLFLELQSHVYKLKKERTADGKDMFEYYVDKIEPFFNGLKDFIESKVDERNFGGLNEFRVSEDWVENGSNDPTELREFYMSKRSIAKEILDNTDVLYQTTAENLLRLICPDDMSEINPHNAVSILNLLTRLNRNNERKFVHPLAARYLLYKLLIMIETAKNNIETEELRTYAERAYGADKTRVKYNNKFTLAEESTADEYFKSKGWIQRKKKFASDFRKQYAKENENQYLLCKEYAIEKVKLCLFEKLVSKISVLIDVFEKFFKDLPKCRKELAVALHKNIERNAKPDKKVKFICASESDKKALYESLGVDATVDNSDINKVVIETLYGKFCVKENKKAEKNKPYSKGSVKDLFIENSKKIYGKLFMSEDYKEYIDMDIYTALCTQSDFAFEAKMSKEDVDVVDESVEKRSKRHESELVSLVAQLRDLASPLLKADADFPEDIGADVDINSAEFADTLFDKNFKPIQKAKTWWGFSSDVSKKCDSLGRILGISVSASESEAYNKYELTCYRGVYGIQAERVKKFNEMNGGDYFTEYTSFINKMVTNILNADPECVGAEEEELASTPHLDKTWHLYLPYISKEKRDEAEKAFYRSFWLAVAYGIVTLDKNENYQIKRTKMVSGVTYDDYEVITYQGRVVGKTNVVELLKALREDGTFMMQTRGLETKFKKECTQYRSHTTYENTELMSGVTVDTYVEGDKKKKVKVGGLASKGDMNALTLIVRYCNDNLCNMTVAALLVRALEEIFTDLVKGNYRPAETKKIAEAMYARCKSVYDACSMKSDDIQFVKEWKKAWSVS